MQPESSFGIPYRLSAERVIAADLKEALCGNESECLQGLNKTAWRAGEFAHTFLSEPARLFSNFSGMIANLTESSALLPTPPPDDAALWKTPWMFCPTPSSMKSGVNCTGAITKEQWRTSKRQLCPQAIQEGTRGQTSPIAAIPVCGMAASLSSLCTDLTQARSLISSANCLKDSIDNNNALCAIKEYVYTPATWETSNMAFVHETVRNYYKRMDNCPARDAAGGGCICPVDYNISHIQEQNQKLLQTCSAQDALVVATLLTQVRGLVTPLTHIIATGLDMLLNFVLMLQGGNTDAQSASEAAKTRMYQGWFTLSGLVQDGVGTVSDITTSTVLANGVVGPILRAAIQDACRAYNFALQYFVEGYCTIIVDKLPIFTTALDQTFGYLDVALQTVNDFISTLVEEVLPQALIAMVHKGYTQLFSANMYAGRLRVVENERLAIRTAATVSAATNLMGDIAKGTGQQAAAAAAKDLAAIMDGSAKKTEKNAAKLVTRALDSIAAVNPYVAPIALVVSTGMIVNDIVDATKAQKAFEHALAQAPLYWTVVEFTPIRVFLRDLTEFLTGGNPVCSYPPDPLTCPVFNLISNGTPYTTYAPPSATQCWADAQVQQIGTSNLYACTPSSTCHSDAVSGSTMLCAECPLQQSTLYVPFGCNVAQQRCQCNIMSTTPAACSSHSDCTSDSFCNVLADAGSTSFGVNMCGACPIPGVCIIQNPGRLGSCTCLANKNPYQLCDAGSVGKLVIPSPPLLELYSTQPISSLYIWDDSAVISASQARQATCVQVSSPGGTVTMALASRVIPSTVSPAGRRLLADVENHTDQSFTDYPDFFTSASPPDHLAASVIHSILMAPGWNTTSAPCSTVAFAYQQGTALTPADESIAHTCAYWRHIGRIVIDRFNLTALQNIDTFLLSADDLAASMGYNGVMRELLTHPRLLITVLMYSSWFKPVRAAFWLHYHQHIRELFDKRLGALGESVIHAAKKVFGTDPSPHTAYIKKTDKRNTTRSQHMGATQRGSVNQALVRPKQQHGRRLLDTAAGVLTSIRTSPYMAFFSRNTPTENLNSSLGTCLPAQVALSTGLQVVHVVGTYYTKFENINANRNLTSSLWAVLPNIQLSQLSSVKFSDVAAWASYSDFAVRTTLGLFSLTPDDMVALFTYTSTQNNYFTVDYVVRSLTSCDFPSLMYCQNHTRDFLYSLVLGLLMYMGAAALASYIGLPVLGTLVFYSIPIMALWYSYGVTPTCFPMVPPCLTDDILSRLNSLFPLTTSLPTALMCDPPSPSCLVSCSTLGFTSWQDPIAFLAAELGVAGQLANTTWLQDGLSLLTISNTAVNLRQKVAMVASPDVNAYAICAAVTAVSALPALLVVATAVGFAGSLVLSVFSLVPSLATLTWHVLTFDDVD